MLLVSAGTFAQKRSKTLGEPVKAKANTEISAYNAAPAKMAPQREVLSASVPFKAPRRTMADEVWYQRPEGSLYISGTDNNGDPISWLYMPAFTTVTYKNMSVEK